MLRSINTSLLCLCMVLPGVVLSACGGDDDDASEGGGASDSGRSGAASTGGKSTGDAAAGESAAAGETSSGASANGGAGAGVAGEPAAGGHRAILAPVDLGTAQNYAVLAKTAISNVPTSKVTGDLGLSPAAASYVTGFALTKAGPSWTSKQVVGEVFAADNDAPTPALLTTAVKDMMTAYTDAAGRKLPDFVELGAGAIGGATLTPGLYKWTSTVTIPTDVTLEGDADDVWIFQVSGDLKLAAAQSMILSGGADPANIFWQVTGVAELGTTSHAEGIVLAKTAIKLQTGASINGRLLAQSAVNLAGATVTAPE
jgi:Ice-binding-like